MAKKLKSVAITITVEGDEKKLFTLYLEKDGTVTIPMSTGEYFSNNKAENTDSNKVLQSRYSIHPSPKSPTGVTTIKYKWRTAKEEKKDNEEVNYTQCVKAKQGYGHVYAKLCNNFAKPRYSLKEKEKYDEVINIGLFNVKEGSLGYGLFVSSLEETSLSGNGYVNITTFVLGVFRITLAWGFVPLIPYTFARYAHGMKSPIKGLTNPNLSADDCVKYLITVMSWLLQITARQIADEHPDMIDVLKWTTLNPPLFKDLKTYREWLTHAITYKSFPMPPKIPLAWK